MDLNFPSDAPFVGENPMKIRWFFAFRHTVKCQRNAY